MKKERVDENEDDSDLIDEDPLEEGIKLDMAISNALSLIIEARNPNYTCIAASAVETLVRVRRELR